MMRLNRRYILSAVAIWSVLAVVSIATRTPVPAFLNYADRNDFGCCDPAIAGDTWLRVCGNSSSRGYTLPLIYSSETTGAPISLTVSALDYHQDAIDCTHLDVESVAVTVNGKCNDIALPQGKTRVAFQSHYSGTVANCVLQLPDEIVPAADTEISVSAVVVISTGDETKRYTISGVLGRSRWSGYWLIFEALAPHA